MADFKPPTWIKFFPRDWRGSEKVAQMSASGRGLYISMLMAQCETGSLPTNPKALARVVNLSLAEVRKGLKEVETCFEVEECRFINRRMELEINSAFSKANKASESAKSRWDKEVVDANASCDGNANAYADAYPNAYAFALSASTSASVVESKPNKQHHRARGSELDGRFTRFWGLYPKKHGKDVAVRAWTKLAPSQELADEIIAHVEKRAKTFDWTKENGTFVPMASTFLNQGRWKDEMKEAGPRFANQPAPYELPYQDGHAILAQEAEQRRLDDEEYDREHATAANN